MDYTQNPFLKDDNVYYSEVEDIRDDVNALATEISQINITLTDDIKNVDGIGDSLFEKINIYNGKYHVLGGLISPLDGIGPDDININRLISRIKRDNVEEIILTLKPSIEGETTMQYIKKILENKNVKITKIATGIPIGTDIEYIDPMTLEFALEGRKDI